MVQLHDSLMSEFLQVLEPCRAHCTVRDVAPDRYAWESLEGQLLLKSETAVELGGGGLPAVGGVLCACGRSMIEREPGGTHPEASGGRRVTLCGPDLPALKGNVPYARVTLVHVREAFTAEEQKLYRLIRSVEYLRYRVSPRGYVPRISTVQGREQVRVSGEAVRGGLDFFKVGRAYGDVFRKHPAVASAETFFITLDSFDYKALQGLFDRAEHATTSLEHPLDRLSMDCASCSLKQVCDEAEAVKKWQSRNAKDV